jgi:hypothetical protein
MNAMVIGLKSNEVARILDNAVGNRQIHHAAPHALDQEGREVDFDFWEYA